MKQRFIYISLLFLLFAAKSYAQPRYVIAEQALCWNTGSQDSSITRYLLITSQGALDSVMTLDQYGNPVTVTGGTITFGHCGCCNGGGGGGGTDTNIYNSSGTLTGNRFVSGDSLYSLIFYNIDSLLLRQAKLILGNPNNQIKYTTYDGYQGQVLGYDAGGDSTYWTHTIDTAFVSNDTLFIVIPSDTIVIPQAAGWLATYLPTQNVVIGTNNHSLIFTNGNIFSWATDTTSGNWIMQGYLDPSLSGGVVS